MLEVNFMFSCELLNERGDMRDIRENKSFELYMCNCVAPN